MIGDHSRPKRLSHPPAGLSRYPYARTVRCHRPCKRSVCAGRNTHHYRSSTRTASIATTKTGHGFQKISFHTLWDQCEVRARRRRRPAWLDLDHRRRSRICWRFDSLTSRRRSGSCSRASAKGTPAWLGDPTLLRGTALSCGIRDLDPYEHGDTIWMQYWRDVSHDLQDRRRRRTLTCFYSLLQKVLCARRLRLRLVWVR